MTKRVLITLPSDEKILSDEKGKGGMNHVKMGWGNKYRNIIFLGTLITFIFLGFYIWFLREHSDFGEYLSKSLVKGILISIILAVLVLAHQWRVLNQINEGKYPTKKETVVTTLTMLLFSGFIFLAGLMRMDLPYDLFLVVMVTTGFIFSIIDYPMTIYWEWKNRKTIYLVEEKLLRWRPVALPVQVPEKG